MKKLLSIFMVAVLLVIAGCGTKADYSSEEVTTEETVTVKQEQKVFTDFKYDFSKNPYYQKDNHNVVVAEDGYYFVRNMSFNGVLDNFVNNEYQYVQGITDNKKYGKMIYYYDINTQEVTPLCSKTNCSHISETCEAYFKNVPNEGFVYYNNHLYMRTYDINAGISLVSYDKNGGNRKEESVICDNPEYQPFVGNNNDVCILNDNVYSWARRNITVNGDAGYEIVLYKTDIKTGETETILNIDETLTQYNNTENYNCDLQVANDELYIKLCNYDDKEDMFTFILYKLDEQTGKPVELLRTMAPRDCNNRSEGDSYAYMKGFAIDGSGNVFFVDELSGEQLIKKAKLCKYNINTGEVKDVYDIGNLISYCVMCDNDRIYLETQVGNSASKLIILDKDGNNIYTKAFGGLVHLVGLDERYVIVSLIDGNDFKDETQIGSWAEVYRYAVLRKASIGTGNEEWKQMYDGLIL